MVQLVQFGVDLLIWMAFLLWPFALLGLLVWWVKRQG